MQLGQRRSEHVGVPSRSLLFGRTMAYPSPAQPSLAATLSHSVTHHVQSATAKLQSCRKAIEEVHTVRAANRRFPSEFTSSSVQRALHDYKTLEQHLGTAKQIFHGSEESLSSLRGRQRPDTQLSMQDAEVEIDRAHLLWAGMRLFLSQQENVTLTGVIPPQEDSQSNSRASGSSSSSNYTNFSRPLPVQAPCVSPTWRMDQLRSAGGSGRKLRSATSPSLSGSCPVSSIPEATCWDAHSLGSASTRSSVSRPSWVPPFAGLQGVQSVPFEYDRIRTASMTSETSSSAPNAPLRHLSLKDATRLQRSLSSLSRLKGKGLFSGWRRSGGPQRDVVCYPSYNYVPSSPGTGSRSATFYSDIHKASRRDSVRTLASDALWHLHWPTGLQRNRN